MHAYLCDFVLDIGQNSLEAGAKNIELDFIETEASLSVRVEDDGGGMTEEERAKALDPFYTDGKKHPGRKVGLGIPFLIQTLEMTGRKAEIHTEKGRGTRFEFSFDLGHLDTPPLGDPVPMFLALLTMDGDYELAVLRRREGADPLDYGFRRSELSEAVGGLSGASSLALLREFLASQEGR